MAFINSDGQHVSYECSDLIHELREDIEEFGGHTSVAVWCKKQMGVTIYTNYDFIDEEDPIRTDELEKDEHIERMTMTTLLILLEKQNSVF